MTKVLKWRLKNQPTAEELVRLVENDILTKDEAREILVRDINVSSSDVDEIKKQVIVLHKIIKTIVEDKPVMLDNIRKQISENVKESKFQRWAQIVAKDYGISLDD